SPGDDSTTTSKGRQQTSQSVVKHCVSRLVSISRWHSCPQKGQATVSFTFIATSLLRIPSSRHFVAHFVPGPWFALREPHLGSAYSFSARIGTNELADNAVPAPVHARPWP